MVSRSRFSVGCVIDPRSCLALVEVPPRMRADWVSRTPERGDPCERRGRLVRAEKLLRESTSGGLPLSAPEEGG